MIAEFCPRCTAPLETSQDADRLCEVCGWWGGQEEVLPTPPREVNNPALAAAQALELYRVVCRTELEAEQAYGAGSLTEGDLRQVHAARRHAGHSIISMFVALWNRVIGQ